MGLDFSNLSEEALEGVVREHLGPVALTDGATIEQLGKLLPEYADPGALYLDPLARPKARISRAFVYR